MRAAVLALLLSPAALAPAAAFAEAPLAPAASGARFELPVFPPGRSETINVIQWDANALPRIYQRSDQLPLTDPDLVKLAQAGFEAPQLVKMIEERRCACDASADGLIRLRKQGVPQQVISAVSLHALRPNRALELLLTLDFTGAGTEARESTLYLFLDDGDLTRVLTANVGDLLARKNAHEELVDRSDLLLTREVRRIQLPGQMPLKTYGKHRLLVASSANPTLTHPSQLSPQELERAQSYTFEYPRSSVLSLCRLTAGYKRDPVLGYRWNFVGSRFDCEWN